MVFSAGVGQMAFCLHGKAGTTGADRMAQDLPGKGREGYLGWRMWMTLLSHTKDTGASTELLQRKQEARRYQ